MKSISQANDLIEFIKAADFYNKIQVTSEGETETLWYLTDESKWITANEGGETSELTKEVVLAKLQNLPDDSQVLIAGNDTAGVLTYKF